MVKAFCNAEAVLLVRVRSFPVKSARPPIPSVRWTIPPMSAKIPRRNSATASAMIPLERVRFGPMSVHPGTKGMVIRLAAVNLDLLQTLFR